MSTIMLLFHLGTQYAIATNTNDPRYGCGVSTGLEVSCHGVPDNETHLSQTEVIEKVYRRLQCNDLFGMAFEKLNKYTMDLMFGIHWFKRS